MDPDPTRRTLVGALGALGAGAAALAIARPGVADQSTASPTPMPRPPAFRGQHQPRPLPFDPAKLEGLSEKLVRSHWENNYGGSVRALNAVEQRLDVMRRDADIPAFVYGDLKREELVRTGSVVLHEQYFANMGGDGKASGGALDLITRDFGSYEEWEAEFKRTAGALAGGSGWVVLALNLHTGVAHNYWAWDHMHNATMGFPLLVLDMYEHSYQMDFGAAAAQYVDAFLKNTQWDEVNRRVERHRSFRALEAGLPSRPDGQ